MSEGFPSRIQSTRPDEIAIRAEISRREDEIRRLTRLMGRRDNTGRQHTIGAMDMMRQQQRHHERTINALKWVLGEDLLWE